MSAMLSSYLRRSHLRERRGGRSLWAQSIPAGKLPVAGLGHSASRHSQKSGNLYGRDDPQTRSRSGFDANRCDLQIYINDS